MPTFHIDTKRGITLICGKSRRLLQVIRKIETALSSPNVFRSKDTGLKQGKVYLKL